MSLQHEMLVIKISYTLYLNNIQQGVHLVDQDVDETITLKYVLKERSGKVCTGFSWLRMGPSGEVL
jgi:hypothetical protein